MSCKRWSKAWQKPCNESASRKILRFECQSLARVLLIAKLSKKVQKTSLRLKLAQGCPSLPWWWVPSLVGCRSMVRQPCSLLPQILHSFLKWCHCERREVKELYPLWLRRVFNWCLLHLASDSSGTMLKTHCSLTTFDQAAHNRRNGFRHSAQFPGWLVSACHLHTPSIKSVFFSRGPIYTIAYTTI